LIVQLLISWSLLIERVLVMRHVSLVVTLSFVINSSVLCLSSQAATIPNLFGTGQAADGSLLPDGSVELHYSLVTSPSGSGYGPNTFVVNNSGYPIGPGNWFDDGPTSKWIGPLANMYVSSPEGICVYRTTFDLTGYDPLTAKITGQWSTDNNGVDILINETSTGNTITDGHVTPYTYWQFTPFTVSSGFVAGINTLDFVVNNYPGGSLNPTGLRVEMSGTAVPEPSTIALLGICAMGILGWIGRRCRK
jgi:hypothetical protein